MRSVLAFPVIVLPILLGGCSLGFGGAPLVSGASIADAQARNAEPQPLDSLPPDAAGLPSGPNSVAPDYAAFRIGPGAGHGVH